jgi:hypothetical protein
VEKFNSDKRSSLLNPTSINKYWSSRKTLQTIFSYPNSFFSWAKMFESVKRSSLLPAKGVYSICPGDVHSYLVFALKVFMIDGHLN